MPHALAETSEALKIFHEIGDRAAAAAVLRSRAALFRRQGDERAAAKALAE